MNREDLKDLFSEKGEDDLIPADQSSPFAQPKLHSEQQPAVTKRHSTAEQILATLNRIEHSLGDVRRTLSATAREHRHREFSPARLIGSILQALVLGLLLWAVSDWVFGEPHNALLVKIAFAAVLQLTALTAFVLGREVE